MTRDMTIGITIAIAERTIVNVSGSDDRNGAISITIDITTTGCGFRGATNQASSELGADGFQVIGSIVSG
jgi:hypothetical protein